MTDIKYENDQPKVVDTHIAAIAAIDVQIDKLRGELRDLRDRQATHFAFLREMRAENAENGGENE